MADWDVVATKPAAATADPWAVRAMGPAPPPAATVGNTLGGVASVLANGIWNIPHAAMHGAVDLARRVAGSDLNAPDPSLVQAAGVQMPQEGKDLMARIAASAPGQAVSNALHSADTSVGNFSPVLQGAMHQAGGSLQDALAMAPVAGAAEGVAGAVGSAADAAAAAAANAPGWAKYGFRTAEDAPIARNVAGDSGKEALGLHNQALSAPVASAEAGVPHGTPLSADALAAAREAPNSVYNRVAQSLPEGPLSPAAQQIIQNAGSSGRITTGSPAAATAIGKLKAELTNPTGNFSGDRVVNELRGLRQEGYTNIGSEDVSNQQLGKAQLEMAKGLEQHITDTLPANGTVSTQQLQDARTALAKNSTVESVMKGPLVDMQALGRINQNNPDLLTGGLKDMAEFASAHPEVSSLPSAGTRYNPPGLMKDLANVNLVEHPLQSPAQLAGGFAARNFLTGNTAKAIANAQARFPGAPASRFAPLEPKLPSPGDLTVAPEQPPTPPAGGPPGGPPGGFSLADVLSTGVEHPPAPGLSLADATAPQQSGIPFRQNAEHMAGGLTLADELASGTMAPNAAAAMPHQGSLADVMSQGVPEGIMQRTPPPGRPWGGVLFRGTPEGADPMAFNEHGQRFMTPNVVPAEGGTAAQDYAQNGGQVTAHAVRMNNMLDADSPEHAAEQLNIPKDSDVVTIAKAAAQAGYDGLHYKVGKAHEYVQLSPPSQLPSAPGLGHEISPPDIPF